MFAKLGEFEGWGCQGVASDSRASRKSKQTASCAGLVDLLGMSNFILRPCRQLRALSRVRGTSRLQHGTSSERGCRVSRGWLGASAITQQNLRVLAYELCEVTVELEGSGGF